MTTLQERFWRRTIKLSDDQCWIWHGGLSRAGYGYFYVRENGKTVQKRAHRVAYELMIGEIPDALVCCHRCDNRACVNPHHIFLGTRDENQKDMHRKSRAAFGTKSPTCKLSEQDVKEILVRIQNGESRISIAKDYPVSRADIGAIASRKIWSHIEVDSSFHPPAIVNRGESNGNARITGSQVIEMRQQHQNGRTIASLAREYGIGETTAAQIIKRQTWRHI